MAIKIVSSLGPQMHHSYLRPKKFFKPVYNREYPWVKPNGGLWTSTFDPETKSSSWLEWCIAESFFVTDWRWGYIYEVKPKLKIIEIDSQEDLHALNDEFGRSVGEFWKNKGVPELDRDPKRVPDFEKLALAGYDGIHLTDQGQWKTRLPRTGDDLYGWDCESTLWLRVDERNPLTFVQKLRLNAVKGRRETRQELKDKAQVVRNRVRRVLEEAKQETQNVEQRAS